MAQRRISTTTIPSLQLRSTLCVEERSVTKTRMNKSSMFDNKHVIIDGNNNAYSNHHLLQYRLLDDENISNQKIPHEDITAVLHNNMTEHVCIPCDDDNGPTFIAIKSETRKRYEKPSSSSLLRSNMQKPSSDGFNSSKGENTTRNINRSNVNTATTNMNMLYLEEEEEEQRDELHSDLYSSVIESLRVHIIDCLPEISEGMVSRAIINGFGSKIYYRNEIESDALSIGDEEMYDDIDQLEVRYLSNAWEQHIKYNGSTSIDKKQRLVAFEQCLKEVFMQIRDGVLTTSNQAMRILLKIASILGMQIDESVYILNDTILLTGLNKNTSRNHIQEYFTRYGDLLAVACTNRGFGFCRFREEISVNKILQERDNIQINGMKPVIHLLGEKHSASSFLNLSSFPANNKISEIPSSAENSPNCVSKHIAPTRWYNFDLIDEKEIEFPFTSR